MREDSQLLISVCLYKKACVNSNIVHWSKTNLSLIIPLVYSILPEHSKIYEYLDFPGGSVLKTYLLMQDFQVQSLGGEDSMEKEMATHSSILA